MSSQRFSGVSLHYAALLVQIVSTVAYVPLLLRLLGQGGYGLYQMVFSAVSVLGFLPLGLSEAYVRFHARFFTARDDAGMARLDGLYLTLFLLAALLCMAAGGISFVWIPALLLPTASPEEAETIRLLFLLMMANMALSFPLALFQSRLRAEEDFAVLRGGALAVVCLHPLCTLPFLFAGYGSPSIAAVLLSLNAALFLLYGWYGVRRLGMRFDCSSFDLPLFKEVWGFSFWIFLGVIANQTIWILGCFLLGRYVGPESVAVFNVGALLTTFYVALSAGIASVHTPQVNRLVERGASSTELTRLFLDIGSVQFCILFYVLGGVIILGRWFFAVWMGEGCGNAYAVALLLMVSLTVPLTQNIGLEMMKALGLHRMRVFIGTAGLLVSAVLACLLLRTWQETGVAAAMAIAFILCNGAASSLYYARRMGLDMAAFWKMLSQLAFRLCPPLLLGMGWTRIFPVDSLPSFLAVGIVYTALYAAFLWGGVLNTEQKAFCRRLILRRRLSGTS